MPLIEAMALGTPVVARATSAIPWTLGDAGLLWESADPHLIATAALRVADDAGLRTCLVERGRARYAAAFAPVVLERGLAASIARLAHR